MKTILTDEELLQKGMEVLNKELGLVNTGRFISLLCRDSSIIKNKLIKREKSKFMMWGQTNEATLSHFVSWTLMCATEEGKKYTVKKCKTTAEKSCCFYCLETIIKNTRTFL